MRMKLFFVWAAFIGAIFSSPAAADEFFGLTPSGSTEAYFPLSLVETSDVLANGCVDVGWTTVSSTETVVVCELPVSTGNALLNALAGPKYATPPRQFIRFNLAEQKGYARVQVTGWQEIQTAFGQTQRTELGNENYHNNVSFLMISLGAHYPPGTEFPNHASMNVDYKFTDLHGGGLFVKEVESGGAFAQAGIRSGDIVTHIARERIKNNNDVSDGLHKAIQNKTFEVQLYRDDEKLKIQVPLIFRETAPPLPEIIIEDDTSDTKSTVILQNEFSIADELAKLAALKEQGIITQEEFDQQKAKLLER